MAEAELDANDRSSHAPVRDRLRTFLATHRRRTWLGAVGAVVLAAAAVLWIRYLGTFESTDDAQIDSNVSAVGPRVAGTVIRAPVQDNQRVQPGDVVAQLDPADYRVALDRARANLALAEAQARSGGRAVPITNVSNRTSLSTAQQDVISARAELAASDRDRDTAIARLKEAEANEALAAVELDRSHHLVDVKAVSQDDLDQHQAAADARAAEVAASRSAVEASRRHGDESAAKLEQARSRLGQVEENAPAQLEQTQDSADALDAAVAAARAAVDQATLDLSYTRIAAPVAGVVGQKGFDVGDRVQPAQQLLAVVQIDDLWVTANFKETQVRSMRVGQAADVHVDALARTYRGHVESLPGASGSRFSLLPPENATGNYVKVVQRLPVRIRLDPGQADADRLRPGMSVEPRVWLH